MSSLCTELCLFQMNFQNRYTQGPSNSVNIWLKHIMNGPSFLKYMFDKLSLECNYGKRRAMNIKSKPSQGGGGGFFLSLLGCICDHHIKRRHLDQKIKFGILMFSTRTFCKLQIDTHKKKKREEKNWNWIFHFGYSNFMTSLYNCKERNTLCTIIMWNSLVRRASPFDMTNHILYMM